MNRISQEGADHINKMINAIVDSIDNKLGSVPEVAPAAVSGKKSKAAPVAPIEPSVNLIADEMNGLMELANQVEREWEKI